MLQRIRGLLLRWALKRASDTDLIHEMRNRNDALAIASGKRVIETDGRLEINGAQFAWCGTEHAIELLIIKLEQNIEIEDLTEPHKPKGAT